MLKLGRYPPKKIQSSHLKWERGNSGAGARGAHEEGENPWELVKVLVSQHFIPAPRTISHFV